MSVKNLVIIGAGNFAREVVAWAEDINKTNRNWEIKGLLDDNMNVLDGYHLKYPILSTISEYVPQPYDVFVCSIGNPELKLDICNRFVSMGAEFINIIHPTAIIGPNCNIGNGIIMCPYSVITTNVTLGNFVTINVHSTIGHDAKVEDGCTLSGHCDVTGFAHLKKGVFMGTGARVLPKARVEEFATIGAGSVVLKKVHSGRTVFGVPAKYID